MGGSHSHAPLASAARPHRLSAGVKFTAMLIVVLSVSLCPRAYAPFLLIPAAFILTALFFARIPLGSRHGFFARLLLLEPFVIGVALLAFFTPHQTLAERWLFFAFLIARCTLALSTMVLFTSTTPFAAILALFRRLHIPILLITTLALMHRYLFVLSDEAARMRRARQCRTFTPTRRFAWRSMSTIVAHLFLRASERADHIYDAMRARGWNSSK